MFPVPAVPKPTLAEEVHTNVVPATPPVKLRPGAVTPLQYVESPCAYTFGVGFTVTRKVIVPPPQPVTLGVTVTVATTGVEPPLSATYAPMLPEPPVPKPTLSEDTQVKVM